ncbi:ras guanine nucleotide exchange factor F [Xenopus laevis]|uniref:Ras Guanine nucleotide exchange factor F n=2 Tax=Xenopus laevis TaxID=8355 RepID=A0A1L8EVD4_XENLA|nr:ras guanine nucleotide exchange factor F [Xenopus laevis]XP_018091118.1 ras guanine nucleotide exchange factor F [Xenopus laevis]XP_041432046.1 ras guanine nucleotide exchange factor F [Xenopus laevis]OCT63290.1 hypothetical protein XELAEV_18044388mg [Xenopus laevis]
MKKEHGDCVWEQVPQSDAAPCDRFKHSCALYNGYVYIYGGRKDSNLGDFWRYNIAHNEWEQLPCSKEAPDQLEGHSMVAHEGVLYVFGGMIDSPANQESTPLWMYAIDVQMWYEGKSPGCKGKSPTNRKGHSAVLHQTSMYIYGGYFDLKGAVEEFWAFSFDAENWSALSPHTRGTGPGPRHGHTAVTYNGAMYLFGGLKNMAEQNDFWKFDFRRHNWSNIKTSSGPPKLVGHGSLVHQNCMWIVGGGLASRNPSSHLWKYHFNTRLWKKVSHGKEGSHLGKIYHSVTGVSPQTQQAQDVGDKETLLPRIPAGKRLSSWASDKVGSVPRTEDIEMKALNQFDMPVFCSCSFSSQDLADEQHLLSHCENSLFTSTGNINVGCESKEPLPVCDSEDFILIIGGKPLSRPSVISVWQLKLGHA